MIVALGWLVFAVVVTFVVANLAAMAVAPKPGRPSLQSPAELTEQELLKEQCCGYRAAELAAQKARGVKVAGNLSYPIGCDE